MSWIVLLAGGVLGAVVVLFVQGLRNERAAAHDWASLLSPQRSSLLRRAQGQLDDGLTLAEVAYRRAGTLRQLGSTAEAIELLKTGYMLIDRFAPDLLRLLAMMAVYSRMVSAIVPVRPLSAVPFQTTGMSILARLSGLIHHMLVNTVERFRFRLYVLGYGVRLLLRGLARSTTRLVHWRTRGEPASPADEWLEIDAIRADFRTLTAESVESLRALLMSLEAMERKR